jgi:predicted RNase H-like HicB family nuclease
VTHYIAILVEAQSGQWRALFPDVPDCEALGYGLANVKRAAAESLKRHSESVDVQLQRPRTLSEIELDVDWLQRNDIDFNSAVVIIVPWPEDPFTPGAAADFPIREKYYRCYFVKDDHIMGYEAVFSHDDVGAIEKVTTLLGERNTRSAELWRGANCIARFDESGSAA